RKKVSPLTPAWASAPGRKTAILTLIAWPWNGITRCNEKPLDYPGDNARDRVLFGRLAAVSRSGRARSWRSYRSPASLARRLQSCVEGGVARARCFEPCHDRKSRFPDLLHRLCHFLARAGRNDRPQTASALPEPGGRANRLGRRRARPDAGA